MKKYRVTLNYKLTKENVVQPMTYVDATDQQSANDLAVKKTLVCIDYLIVQQLD